jgi:hypothetical protein
VLAKGDIRLSYDLRAHLSPERQSHIIKAADDLWQRLNSLCLACHTPGFWPDKAVPGLPCEACGSATGLTLQKQASCQRCQHSMVHNVAQRYADPQYCPECNP